MADAPRADHRRIARRRFPTRRRSSLGPPRGDRTAFAQLMEHYQSACYGLAWRLLGDPDQAADATQDAFIHAYKAIGSYRGGIFRSWLLRITANASYDILRRAQRRPTSPLPDPEEGAPELPDLGRRQPGRGGDASRDVPAPRGRAARGCRRTSEPRSCSATSMAWTTTRWRP